MTVSDRTARRLARMTLDVLLPAHYSGIDLTDIKVDAVRVGLGEYDFEELTDFVQTTVLEARVVLVDEQRG